LILQCCRAIQHAHLKGIIHRDIKPSNVMVTQVDGEPAVKVIDFGIAKATLDDSVRESNEYTSSVVSLLSRNITRQGTSPGTPPFMSPEQYSGDSSSVDTRSDIYSLGALLYLILTEKVPFYQHSIFGKSLSQVAALISSEDPILPSLSAPELALQLRGDIDSIVQKAMQREVEDRYQSVDLFARDLRSYLRGEQVSTNPGNKLDQFRKWASRNKLLIATCFLAFSGVLLGWFLAERQRGLQEKIAAQYKHQSMVSDLLNASMMIQRQEYSSAREMLNQRSADLTPEGYRTHQRLDYRLLSAQIPEPPEIFAEVPGKIYFGLYIPSEKAIACGCNDSKVQLFNCENGEILWEQDTQQKEVNGLALSPDNSLLATAGDDGTVKLWDLKNRSLVSQIQASSKGVFQIAWSPDGRYLVSVGNEPKATVWSYPDGRQVRQFESGEVDLECIASNKDGLFAFGNEKGDVSIGTMKTEDGIPEVKTPPLSHGREVCSSLAIGASGKFFAMGLNRGYLVILRQSDGGYKPIQQIKFPYDVTSLAFSSDESRLAIGDASGALHLLRVPGDIVELSFQDRKNIWKEFTSLGREGKLASWPAHQKRISSLTWDDNDRDLYSFSEDKTIRKLRPTVPDEHVYHSDTIDLYPTSSDLVFLLDQSNTRISMRTFDARGKTQATPFSRLDSDGVKRLLAHKDKIQIGAIGDPAALPICFGIHQYDPKTHQTELLTELPPGYWLDDLIGTPNSHQWLCYLSPNQETVPSGKRPMAIGVWDHLKKRFLWEDPPSFEPYRYTRMSPDGRFAVYEREAQILRVDLSNGETQVLVHEPGMSVSDMCISPDSKALAVALNAERTIRLYWLGETSSELFAKLRFHGDLVMDTKWSNDGQVLVTISADSILRTYDIASQSLTSEILTPMSTPRFLHIPADQESIFIVDTLGRYSRLPCPWIAPK
jgi:serine/threonine protein kinase/WD40 repeat protein